jgi:hypothetical protein
MSRQARHRKRESDLEALESRFRDALIFALRQTAAGQWGLFGRNDAALDSHFGNAADRYKSPEAADLLRLGEEIQQLRHELGFIEPNQLYERFLSYRRKRSSNDPGEPRLAREFLEEIEPS